MSEPEQEISITDLDNAPVNLPAPAGFDFQAEYEKLNVEFSKVTEEAFTLREENSQLRIRNETRQLLNELIKPFAKRSFIFMCVYSGIVGIMLFLHGFNVWFSLPESVLGYLVGSTAVTVIGLVGMVLTGVFIGGHKK